jgi:hypothetical protein
VAVLSVVVVTVGSAVPGGQPRDAGEPILTENITDERAIGSFIGVTPEETVAQIRKLKAIAARRGYPVIPGHDPVAWPALTAHLAARFPR